MPANGQSGVIAAAQNAVTISCEDNPSVGIEINSPDAWTATLVVEATVNGSTWYTPLTNTPLGAAGSTSFTANGRCIAQAPGAAAVRVRCTSYTSGSPRVTMRATRAL
jgi:hypothetical protein